MSENKLGTPKTTGELRQLLGKALVRLEAGTIEEGVANAMCKVANAINQSFAEETKAILAAKEIGQLQVGFGHTLIGAEADQKLLK